MTHVLPDGRAELRDAALSQCRSSLQLSELTVALIEVHRRLPAHALPPRASMLRSKAVGRLRGRHRAS